jgi:hypothetical protein
MGLQTRQPQERHQFDGKAKNSQWFLEGSVNSPRSRRSIRILDLYPHSRRTGAIRAHGPSMQFSFFCTAKVRENTIHAPHRLRKLLRFSERVEVPCVAGFDCSVRIVVLVIDTEVHALLLGTYTSFEMPAHVFHFFCPSTKTGLHDADTDTKFVRPARSSRGLLGDDWMARMNESGRRIHGPTA